MNINQYSSYAINVNNFINSNYLIIKTTNQFKSSSYSLLLQKLSNSSYNITAHLKSSLSSYNILVGNKNSSNYLINIKSHNQSKFAIDTSNKIQSKYLITVSNSNQSNYYLNPGKQSQSNYNIYIGKSIISPYAIQIHNSNNSQFKIIQIFHIKKHDSSSYYITNYNWITSRNNSRYSINWTGVTSIDERLSYITKPWQTIPSDRTVMPLLYIRHSNDKNAITNAYITVPSKRSLFVERQLLKDERNAIYERYYSQSSNRNNILGGFERFTSDRYNFLSSYSYQFSTRYTISEQRETLDSNRKLFTLCAYNDARYITLHYWWPNERRAISGYCIDHLSYSDQRWCHPQVRISKLEVIRYAYTESCSYIMQLTINPKYNEHICQPVSQTFQQLFNAQVVTENNLFHNIPIDLDHPGFDLFLLNKDGSWWINLATNPLYHIPFTRLTENTWIFDGYLIHRHKPLYTRWEVYFTNLYNHTTAESYYKYLVSHGYIKMEINTEEMKDLDAEIICYEKLYPIPIKLYLYQNLFLNTRFNITFAYPYQKKDLVSKVILVPKKIF